MEIYTDGGCSGNPGPGGWAYIIVENGKQSAEKWGAEEDTTNNRMELMGIISALESLKAADKVSGELMVYTDSEYVQKGITQWIKAWKAKNWRTSARKPVKNQDLWQRLDSLAVSFPLKWIWVKGHAGNFWNERCDALTQKAIEYIRK